MLGCFHLAIKRCCKNCKEYFRPDPDCYPNQRWCSEECKLAIALASIKKTQEGRARSLKKKLAKERSLITSEKRRLNAGDKKLQRTNTQKAFNEMIRLLDAGESCMSCGKEVCGMRMECGHFLSVKAHPELRYDPRNAFLQGSGCNSATEKHNSHKDVVRQRYDKALREKMGDDYVNWLLGPHEMPKYTIEELTELRKTFKAESARLKKGLAPSRNWRELPPEIINAS